MSSHSFPRSERLSGRADLEKVRKEGRRRVLPKLVLFFCPDKAAERSVLPPPRPSVIPCAVTGTFVSLGNSIAYTRIFPDNSHLSSSCAVPCKIGKPLKPACAI